MIKEYEGGLIINWSDKSVSLKRHTTAADDLAFDRLWNERQEIAEIVQCVRDGNKGHKLAITEIEAILERVS